MFETPKPKTTKIIACKEPTTAPRTGSTAKKRRNTIDLSSSSIIVVRKFSGRQRMAS